MRFFAGISIADNAVSFAFATPSRKLICYTGGWASRYVTVESSDVHRVYRGGMRLLDILSDIKEFDSTTLCVIDGSTWEIDTITPFLVSKSVYYRHRYLDSVRFEEKKAYINEAYPHLDIDLPESLCSAIYATRMAEAICSNL